MTTSLHPTLQAVTERIEARSRAARSEYLAIIEAAKAKGSGRARLSCGNLAHVFAASSAEEKQALMGQIPNLGIVTAYNDMLSAHQPLGTYPDVIKQAARKVGAVAQVAGGVPAMCDGVTQGQPGMELSLFSRDVIAMATAVSLSHDAFDAVLALGVCDKIVPGLVMGALRFGHMPVIFVPAGPMPSGLPNKEKARVREQFARGEVGRDALLAAESASYHAPGTCTFYGTANSNQMLMEFMGLHLPGTAFVNPGTPLRQALTEAATVQAAKLARDKAGAMADVLSAKSFVNACVGLMATGGSTNHALHLPAMARAAGFILTWDDMSDLSAVTPLLARVYPNGAADVNHFHAAGGLGFVIRELLAAGLLHEDVETVVGHGLSAYAQEPWLDNGSLSWRPAATESLNPEILRGVADPFRPEGGMRLLTGPLGRSVIKTSAVAPEHQTVEAPARVFDDQDDFLAAFKRGELECDHIAVIRFQGPAANGMPELHKLTPALSVLQDKGFKVALVTDGRMSGASGKVPAAIHMSPEAKLGGMLARLQDGDVIRVCAPEGTVSLVGLSEAELAARPAAPTPAEATGVGRELFGVFRKAAGLAEAGASVFFEF
ncbi:MAG: phosphogluconate dehydratase [Asticcacaulis sp.]